MDKNNEIIQLIEDCVLNGDNGKRKDNPYILGKNIYFKQTGKIYDLLDFYVQENKQSQGSKVGIFLGLNLESKNLDNIRYICAFTNLDDLRNASNVEAPGYASEFPMKYPNELYCEKEIPQIISNRINLKLLNVIRLIRIINPSKENLEKLLKCDEEVNKSSHLVTDDIFCKVSDDWIKELRDLEKHNFDRTDE